MANFHATSFRRVFDVVAAKSYTLDPASLVDGAGSSNTTTLAGATFGDFVLVAAPYDLQGITVTAYVSAADTVTVRIQNESAGTVDLASGTWKILVLRVSPGFFVA